MTRGGGVKVPFYRSLCVGGLQYIVRFLLRSVGILQGGSRRFGKVGLLLKRRRLRGRVMDTSDTPCRSSAGIPLRRVFLA